MVRSSLFISIFFIFTSCQWFKKETFEFKNVTIEQTLADCDTVDDCPVVSLNYLKSEYPKEFAKKFNDTIHKRLLYLLQTHIGEENSFVEYKDIEKAIQVYISDYHELKKIFPETFTYELNVVDSILFQNDTLVSLMSDVYTYSGGAHGYQFVTFLNFKPSGKCYTNQELFTNMDSITHIAEQYFRKKENIKGLLNEHGYWFEQGQFTLAKNIGFEKDSLILHYNPYEIASYSEGAKIIKIPLNRIKKWIFIEK